MSTVVKVAVDGEEVVTSAAEKKIKETFISERGTCDLLLLIRNNNGLLMPIVLLN
jgi:hypothetical protein